MKERTQRIGRADQAVAQRFEDAQIEQGEDFHLFGPGLARFRKQLTEFDCVVHGLLFEKNFTPATCPDSCSK
jgi:hypothetical protein